MKLEDLPQIGMTLVFIAVIFVSGFLVFAGLTDSRPATAGCNTTNYTGCGVAEAGVFTALDNITEGTSNVIEYAPIWGVIIGVAVLLGIVVFGFYFGRTKGFL